MRICCALKMLQHLIWCPEYSKAAFSAGLFALMLNTCLAFCRDNSMEVLHVPLVTLTADTTSTWHDMVVAVVDTGDYEATQACIRLTRVHGVKDVRLVKEASSLPQELR